MQFLTAVFIITIIIIIIIIIIIEWICWMKVWICVTYGTLQEQYL